MRRFLLLLPFTALALPADTAQPASGRNDIDAEFARLDGDKNGKLSPAEAAPHADILKGADADADGALSLAEIRQHLQLSAARQVRDFVETAAQLESTFRDLDKNGDGKVAGREFRNQRWLQWMDKDGDGAVTLPETRLALAKLGRPLDEKPSEKPAPPLESGAAPRQGPIPLKPGDWNIGRRLGDFDLQDLSGKTLPLSSLLGKAGTVIALLSPSCPVSKRYFPELVRLEQEFSARGIRIFFPAPSEGDSAESLAQAGVKGPVVRDRSGAFLRALKAASTTDVFVLDSARTLVFRGAIDDRYGLGYSRDEAGQRFLTKALEAVLRGQAPEVSATTAPGCDLDLQAAQPAAEPAATYHNRISRILQANCESCHRAGGVAPFALETYDQVAAKAGMIRRMVADNLMPPWFAAPPPDGKHSVWKNDRSLSASDKEALLRWLAEGRPLGNPADAPRPRTWPQEWAIGTPDVIYQIPQPISVKAEGTMPYQNVRVETKLAEEKWIRGWEVLPTAREVVHHVLVFVERPGQTREQRRRNSDSEEGGGFFAAFVPGNNSEVYADGFGKILPAGAVLRFQIHYTPNGKAAQDQVRIGMLFAGKKPEHVIEVASAANPKLRIPPGAENHPESGTIPVPVDVTLVGFMPHMHLRGKAFRYEVILPGGETRSLLEVPRYDFNWQLPYHFADRPKIPAGSRIRATGWFDNSAKNPANPDPQRTVPWGPQTTDEMMIGYIEFYR